MIIYIYMGMYIKAYQLTARNKVIKHNVIPSTVLSVALFSPPCQYSEGLRVSLRLSGSPNGSPLSSTNTMLAPTESEEFICRAR